MRGAAIVTAKEMARVEKKSIEEGANAEAYMDKAGSEIARIVKEEYAPKKVLLLLGKGNNGGDALVAGLHLHELGVEVTAYHLYPPQEYSPLCKKKGEAFYQAKGTFLPIEKTTEFPSDCVILDGLLGTGFSGKTEGSLAETIEKANNCGATIVSLDIPSGIDGNSGEAGGSAIKAAMTITLGMAKLGLFIGDGYNHVGALRIVDFGLDEKYQKEAKTNGYLLNEEAALSFLPKIERTRHKYEAGYLLAVAGSPGMPGSAVLACLAALRSGVGIIRLYHMPKMEEELSNAPYELIRSDNFDELFEETKRADALLIGPGMGRNEESKKRFLRLLELHLPMVIDADGLFHLSEVKNFVAKVPTILTPHKKEMERLLGVEPTHEACQKYAKEKNVVLVLKGAPTWIFSCKQAPLVCTRGCPGMATAGTGDVLTGIIGSLLSQKIDSLPAAALGVFLHGRAGEVASRDLSDEAMIASDLIEALPEIFKFI